MFLSCFSCRFVASFRYLLPLFLFLFVLFFADRQMRAAADCRYASLPCSRGHIELERIAPTPVTATWVVAAAHLKVETHHLLLFFRTRD